jgi:nitrite reductase/ring-hydroxylating ferredoxin subunit
VQPDDDGPDDGPDDVITAPADGEVVRTFVDGVAVAVWNVAGTLHAVGDVCPHRGWILSEGPLERDARGDVHVVCPGHHWRFSLTDGECAFSPERLPVFRCVPVDGSSQRVRLVPVPVT